MPCWYIIPANSQINHQTDTHSSSAHGTIAHSAAAPPSIPGRRGCVALIPLLGGGDFPFAQIAVFFDERGLLVVLQNFDMAFASFEKEYLFFLIRVETSCKDVVKTAVEHVQAMLDGRLSVSSPGQQLLLQ